MLDGHEVEEVGVAAGEDGTDSRGQSVTKTGLYGTVRSTLGN